MLFVIDLRVADIVNEHKIILGFRNRVDPAVGKGICVCFGAGNKFTVFKDRFDRFRAGSQLFAGKIAVDRIFPD